MASRRGLLGAGLPTRKGFLAGGSAVRRGAQYTGGVVVANGLLTGLLAYWTLNESSGNRADSSGNGKTMVQQGTVSGAAGFGNVGAVTVFGTNAANRLAVGSTLFGSGDWTIAGWFNCASFASTRCLICQGSFGSFAQAIRLTTTSRISVSVNGSNFDNGGTVLSAGTWYHLAFTYTASGTLVRAYLNGSGTPDVSATRTASYAGNDNFTMGAGDSVTHPANSSMVGWGAWSLVLSAAQISALFNNNDGLAFSSFN